METENPRKREYSTKPKPLTLLMKFPSRKIDACPGRKGRGEVLTVDAVRNTELFLLGTHSCERIGFRDATPMVTWKIERLSH